MINVFNADPATATRFERTIGAIIQAHEQASGHRKALPVMPTKNTNLSELHQQARVRREKVFELIGSQPGVLASEISKHMDLCRKTVSNDLRFLSEAGRICLVGKGTQSGWRACA